MGGPLREKGGKHSELRVAIIQTLAFSANYVCFEQKIVKDFGENLFNVYDDTFPSVFRRKRTVIESRAGKRERVLVAIRTNPCGDPAPHPTVPLQSPFRTQQRHNIFRFRSAPPPHTVVSRTEHSRVINCLG